MKAKSIIITVVVMLAIVILVQNTEVVGFKLLFWQIEMSRIILFPLLLIVGLISGFILGFLTKKKREPQPKP